MLPSKKNIPHTRLMPLYDAAWRLLFPLLPFFPRLRDSVRRRMVPAAYTGLGWGGGITNQDVWLHAASAGEAYLSWEILKHLPKREGKLSVLLTTCTDQGLELLEKTAVWAQAKRPDLAVTKAYFPFDTRVQMRRALERVRPKVVAVLETELWPGLLCACAERAVPMVLLNGRMRPSSLGRYLALRSFFRTVGPAEILAVSEADAMRFGLLFGHERVRTMPNIKFDRVSAPQNDKKSDSPLKGVLGPRTPFAVLGSIRAEEEQDVLSALRIIQGERPKTCIGLFPRHMERIPAWCELLRTSDMDWIRRSELTEQSGPATPGSVILWDVFGELGAAYGLAKAAFVGGSLRPLGGQNFLEPLSMGVATCVGPHWGNFAWAGRELVDSGLLTEVDSPYTLAGQMVKYLNRPPKPAALRKRFSAYLSTRQGGAAQAAGVIAGYLE